MVNKTLRFRAVLFFKAVIIAFIGVMKPSEDVIKNEEDAFFFEKHACESLHGHASAQGFRRLTDVPERLSADTGLDTSESQRTHCSFHSSHTHRLTDDHSEVGSGS